jgi:hypothetical protein
MLAKRVDARWDRDVAELALHDDHRDASLSDLDGVCVAELVRGKAPAQLPLAPPGRTSAVRGWDR